MTSASVREIRETIEEVWTSKRYFSAFYRSALLNPANRIQTGTPDLTVGADWEQDMSYVIPRGVCFTVNVRIDDEGARRRVRFNLTGNPVDRKQGARAIEMMAARLPSA